MDLVRNGSTWACLQTLNLIQRKRRYERNRKSCRIEEWRWMYEKMQVDARRANWGTLQISKDLQIDKPIIYKSVKNLKNNKNLEIQQNQNISDCQKTSEFMIYPPKAFLKIQFTETVRRLSSCWSNASSRTAVTFRFFILRGLKETPNETSSPVHAALTPTVSDRPIPAPANTPTSVPPRRSEPTPKDRRSFNY